MQIVENSSTTLRTIGKDKQWLHDWIVQKPSRLGLGELTIKTSELVHYKNKGGRLDILAYRGDLDTYYEIEVMLGECDTDHGFRVLDDVRRCGSEDGRRWWRRRAVVSLGGLLLVLPMGPARSRPPQPNASPGGGGPLAMVMGNASLADCGAEPTRRVPAERGGHAGAGRRYLRRCSQHALRPVRAQRPRVWVTTTWRF